METTSYVLPLVLALPVLGAIFVMCTPKEEHGLHRGIGIGFSLLTFVASLLLVNGFNAKAAGFQEVFDVSWIPGLNAHFKVGVDGISLWLRLLTTVLPPLTPVAAS